MNLPEFTPFPKIPRFNRQVIVTEKIDGTNASILITETGEFLTASRKRWITPDHDNYGFSRWAHEHKDALMQLGPGHHFGEWWGSGIQRGYGLTGGDKRFSLFNVSRWCNHDDIPSEGQTALPCCISVVPLLWSGLLMHLRIASVLDSLRTCGSAAAPGFTKPEGIVIFHTAGNCLFKMTLENDDTPKSLAG